MRRNKLSPNPEKTEFTVVGYSRKTENLDFPEELKLNNYDIKMVKKAKALCIIINENLAWDDQFENIKNNMNRGLTAMKKPKNIIPQWQLYHVYYTMVESHLRFADVVWSSISKTKLTALQCLQNHSY